MEDATRFPIATPFFAEVNPSRHCGQAYHYTECLFDRTSPYQRVQVFRNPIYGRVMMIDATTMTSDIDEFVYHEALAHVGALGHPNPLRALVIGGGDGGTARELLRHPSIERVVLVDIDEEVLNAARACLPELARGLDHPKTECICRDAIQYVKETKETFDIICVDSTEPVGPGVGLFSKEFYLDCRARLTPEGILTGQTLAPLLQRKDMMGIYRNLKAAFPLVAAYGAPMAVYPGGYWSFCWASVGNRPMKHFARARAESVLKPCRFLNPDLYPALFVLPTFMLEIVETA